MNTSLYAASVCCFGEILWDVLPDGPQPGGAPLNVAYHLEKLGISASLISKIGDDDDGVRLKNLMKQWGLTKDFLQVDSIHETSRVLAKLNKDNEVSYEIVFPVAWDYIETNYALKQAVKAADYFVYGSLATRNAVSKQTLFDLLQDAEYNVFDINLRPPFYDKEILEHLLIKADILKVNHLEIEVIMSLFDVAFKQEIDRVNWLKNKFTIEEVIVTKGAKGASYYAPDSINHVTGPVVKVCDTIGSGDSFLAAFLAFHSQKEPSEIILKKAVAMGAFIAGKKGGCPSYPLSEYMDFYKEE